jgi:hypothetical protein
MKVTLIVMVFVFGLAGFIASEAGAEGVLGGGHPFYTEQELEEIHALNTTALYVVVQEDDGDEWWYVKDANTGEYFEAIN